MKKSIFICLCLSIAIAACDSKEDSKTDAMASCTPSSIELPYEASYTTDFTNDVPDSDLLVVLNSYKAWENGDMAILRATMGDSMYVRGASGFRFAGLTDSLMNDWTLSRDSMSSVKITMNVWTKNHAVKDSSNYVNVWYKEIDTYKTGRVDSANYEDDNGVKDGKVTWFSSHKQILK